MKISVRFDEGVVSTLDSIAEDMNATRSDVMIEAVGLYIDYITWFKGEVQKGLDDLATGRTMSQEDVVESVAKLIQEYRK